ncbi:uncharacterized protein METZ01_LOCUS15251, partial [marine metagenome]
LIRMTVTPEMMRKLLIQMTVIPEMMRKLLIRMTVIPEMMRKLLIRVTVIPEMMRKLLMVTMKRLPQKFCLSTKAKMMLPSTPATQMTPSPTTKGRKV